MLCPKCKNELPAGALVCCYCRRVIVRKASRRTRGNGQGTAYKRGRTWTAAVILGWKTAKDGHRIPDRATEGGFATETEALNFCPTLLQRGKKKDRAKTPAIVRKTILYYWEQFESSDNFKKLLSKGGAYVIAHNKMAELDSRTVNEVTLKELQDLVKAKAPTYYPARDMKTVLTKIWELAIIEGETNINKGEHIPLPELNEDEGEPFTEDEVRKLWQGFASGIIFAGFILLMIYTGMMPGELLKCTKDMIDWEAKTILGCGLKTKKRRETPMVIADFLVPVLRILCTYSSGPKLLPINKDNFYKVYYETLGACGVPQKPPYSCRHTPATRMELDELAPQTTIQKFMRQKNIKSTKRYMHAELQDAREAINAMQPPIAIDYALTTPRPEPVEK